MKILVVGGGSGGHVTPLVAVVAELQTRQPDSSITLWCDRAYFEHAQELMHAHDTAIPVEAIISGKFRRYSSISRLRQLFMIRTIVLPNIIDSVKIMTGFFQSLVKLVRLKPAVVFTKGGFVCLPVGLAARLLNIPLVIHDSDAHPGLTNRILARWATSIATGAPSELYPYPKARTHYVGIPISGHLAPLSSEKQRQAKRELGFNPDRPLVVVTGGGLGALRVNNATVAVLDDLLASTSVMLISGAKQYDELVQQLSTHTDKRTFQLRSHMARGFQTALGASDIVISRAGATTLLELAALAKPAIIIPNARLTGGHQTKNAARYESADAIIVLDDENIETNPGALADATRKLLDDNERRKQLSQNIHSLAKPNAAAATTSLILEAAKA